MYLGLLAIIPNIIYMVMNDTPFIGLSGTSLLIIVGVALELAAQLESYLIEHRYEGFLSTGRMKSRYAR
jgi:preprotein translocase subunit SecY